MKAGYVCIDNYAYSIGSSNLVIGSVNTYLYRSIF